ncbi:hypothetical protein ScFU53_07530 [Streptococcus canis]|uniref:hypothetical protein n=3 Tax=Streptococcus canis TaxID=1329 RepID=UPI0012F310B4|nr:hypothetical protein [Streptococcus canis]GFE43560.1 hypothetical protein ScFU1_12410 [Streptococcus canis]GFE47102.1 hypothetical protein ScFU129_07330 [Streptococcus canis]GFG43741.1 hypothetical protein ScFU53_07530 [Streptococcus canis]
MKLSVRLALETLQNIEELKEIITKENFGELKITNGFVVNQAFRETMGTTDWKKIIQETAPLIQKKFGKLEDTPLKTNLTLNDDTKSFIDELKLEFPKYTDTNYVTVSYIIRIVVRAALLKRIEK